MARWKSCHINASISELSVTWNVYRNWPLELLQAQDVLGYLHAER